MKIALLHGHSFMVFQNVIQPLLRCRKQLAKQGILISFHREIDRSLSRADCVIICDYFYPAPTIYPPEMMEVVHRLKENCKKLIFFDNADSCGNTRFEILDIVDAYWKKQVYRDRKLYLKKLLYSRLYCDFMQQRFDITETLKEDFALPSKPEDLNKIKISWNIGVGPIFQSNPLLRKINNSNFHRGMKLPLYLETHNWQNYHRSWNTRTFDIQFRGNKKMIIHSLSFGRAHVDTLLHQVSDKYRIARGQTLSFESFMQEIFNSKVVISPFGYGEICYRDFEGFAAGACLLKPDMSHLETWPDFYQANSTYIPYKWDFSDFLEKAEDAVSGNTSRAIAARGREAYMTTQSSSWSTQFCQHFSELLQ